MRLEKIKYKLTFLQRVELFFIWFYWASVKSELKKSWHLVKKGMEKHEHNYVVPVTQRGVRFMKCDHEGCDTYDPID